MDLANDERIRRLNELIQAEKNPDKLCELVDELSRLLDEKLATKPTVGVIEGHAACDFLESLYSADEFGEFCGRAATGKCSDCGRHVCDTHSQTCVDCIAVFCTGCIKDHLSGHAFPPKAERIDSVRKRA